MHGIMPDQVERIELAVDETCDRICNIAAPRTGLEAKFSLAADDRDGPGRDRYQPLVLLFRAVADGPV